MDATLSRSSARANRSRSLKVPNQEQISSRLSIAGT
jgi:hypothetical protein